MRTMLFMIVFLIGCGQLMLLFWRVSRWLVTRGTSDSEENISDYTEVHKLHTTQNKATLHLSRDCPTLAQSRTAGTLVSMPVCRVCERNRRLLLSRDLRMHVHKCACACQ